MTTACSLHFMLQNMLGAVQFLQEICYWYLLLATKKLNHEDLCVERRLFHSVERNIFLFESVSAASP